jgi:hypothetical protein
MPSDEFDDRWDFTATAEDVQVMLEVALRVAATDAWPEWNPGSEFKAMRDAMFESVSP